MPQASKNCLVCPKAVKYELILAAQLVAARTVCFIDLGKLVDQQWIDFKLEPIFATSPVAFKNHYKCGQN